jgi:hypothetical protein
LLHKGSSSTGYSGKQLRQIDELGVIVVIKSGMEAVLVRSYMRSMTWRGRAVSFDTSDEARMLLYLSQGHA